MLDGVADLVGEHVGGYVDQNARQVASLKQKKEVLAWHQWELNWWSNWNFWRCNYVRPLIDLQSVA